MKSIAIAACLIAGSLCPAGAAPARPNVILINIDNHNKGSLGFYGNRFLETPNIDRIFREGIRFENYYCAGRCTSSRSALLTGRYHARNGSMGTNGSGAWGQMAGGITTIAHLFARNGYRTAMFGKWHLGETYPLRPEDRGFQEALSVHNGDQGMRFLVAERGYNALPRTARAFRFRHNGKWGEVFKGFRTDIWFSALDRYLAEAAKNKKPFFVYLATITAHGPHFGPEDLRDKFKKKFESPEWADFRAAWKDYQKKHPQKFGEAGPSLPYDHAADLGGLDRNIGRMLATLDKLVLAENTLIVYASDGAGGSFATLRGKDRKYGGTNTPLVFRWTGLGNKPGDSRRELVANLDVLPTLAEICGLDLPPGYPGTIDGQSFATFLSWPGARPCKPRVYVDDHQSGGGKPRSTDGMMLMVPRAQATVHLADGGSVSWREGKPTGKPSPKLLSRAEAAYDQWFAHVLKDFPPGAFGVTGPGTPVVHLLGYPIFEGPAGGGVRNYFLLDVAEDGEVLLDPNISDQYGGKYVPGKPQAVELTLARRKDAGRLPNGFDKTLSGYRVLSDTFRSRFAIESNTVELPARIPLKKGRYFINVRPTTPKPKEPRVLRVKWAGGGS